MKRRMSGQWTEILKNLNLKQNVNNIISYIYPIAFKIYLNDKILLKYSFNIQLIIYLHYFKSIQNRLGSKSKYHYS